MADVEQVVEDTIAYVREQGDPKHMTQDEWRDYLSSLIDELQIELSAAG